jgi:hypothetical protein
MVRVAAVEASYTIAIEDKESTLEMLVRELRVMLQGRQ